MLKDLTSSTTLHNGVTMPWLGLGVYKVDDGEEVIQSVETALANGYRSIDTAAVYQNEVGVGQAIQNSGLPRDQLFITSKVWNSSQGYEETLQAYEDSLARLNLDYLDLYLIHWPAPKLNQYQDTWRALEKLYQDGKVRAIGVSNFQITHLTELIDNCTIVPMVNQVEFHPHLTQEPLRDFCRKHNIQVEAWSPLKQGQLLNDPTLVKIAEKYQKSTAQVIIRWDLQSGVVTIPKSVKADRIVANSDVFDFELTDQEMQQINALNKDERCGPNPDHFWAE
ncbi:aldo/keto reductase [Amphibacillus sediminis]|uniref:aldo/keto reductase n=1 Tax=Amphibacillus sediminis TaxID=360185 RepID=UPI000829731D|nr:aldo/keto reductase [Amphibacillus sediminis]